MDCNIFKGIEALRLPQNDTPGRRFTDFAPETGMDHVLDPYYTRDFEKILDLAEAASRGLLRALA